MELKAPAREEVEQVRQWRNINLAPWRTPYPLTEEMQGDFYDNVICNRNTNNRYWSIYNDYGNFVGLGGITNIQWENGLAEIALHISPEHGGKGYGRRSFQMVLAEAFGNMGLKTVYGECYECNPAIEFWVKMTKEHGGYLTMIPRRKLWQGRLYDALHFTVWR